MLKYQLESLSDCQRTEIKINAMNYDMKILVCIKQVGDDGQMNRFDAHALEEALLMKEQQQAAQTSKPVTVHVVTAGPEAATDIIRRTFGLRKSRVKLESLEKV